MRVCARVGAVRSVLSPRARLCPVKISISVEHSIVMAMCLSSYGRSSSDRACLSPPPTPRNKWIAERAFVVRSREIRRGKERRELFLG